MAGSLGSAALLGCLVLAAASPAVAAGSNAPDCYDVKVIASLVKQTPTVVLDCQGCLTMRWPWILDLEVTRVLEGATSRGPLTVLSLEHDYAYRRLGPRRIFLRRNDVGGFNWVHLDNGEARRCNADLAPAKAYIRPQDGKTLDDLRREGEAYYGKSPGR